MAEGFAVGEAVFTKEQILHMWRQMRPELFEWRRRLYGRYDVRLFLLPGERLLVRYG